MTRLYKYDPPIAFPPGVIVKDMLEEQGISQVEFADKMGMTSEQASRFLDGEIPITPTLAKSLSAVVGGDSDYWLRMQTFFTSYITTLSH